MLAFLVGQQRTIGTRFEYYRQGLGFDETDAATIAIIAARALPQNNLNIQSAYDGAQNQILQARRDNLLTAKDFDRVSDPRFNVRRAAARRNPNDMAQARADFLALKTRWGNQLKC